MSAIHDGLDLIVSSGRQDPDRVRGAAIIDALLAPACPACPGRWPACRGGQCPVTLPLRPRRNPRARRP